MGTFQARTEDYVGSIADTTALADWFTAGAKRLIDLIPPEKLERFSTTLTDTGSGIDISSHRFIRAHKAGRGAVLIDAGLKTQAADSTSIFYGTATSPVCYLEATKAYVLPGGGSIIAVVYPTVTYSASSISNFPTEWEQGVVLFAAIQAAIGLMNTSITTLSGLSLGAISTTPSAPTDASYSYSDASLGTYSATTIGSLGTPPTYTKPTTTFSITDATTYISSEEDLDKAHAELSKQSSLIELFGKDLYNELNEFNKENAEYASTVQKAIRQAELDQERLIVSASKTTDLNLQNAAQTLNAAIELYKSNMEKYLGQINQYGAEVNKVVNEYQVKVQQAQAVTDKYQTLVTQLQNEYKAFLETIR